MELGTSAEQVGFLKVQEKQDRVGASELVPLLAKAVELLTQDTQLL